MNYLFTYLAVAIAFVAIDMIWLGTMAERLYRPVLGEMLRLQPNLAAAAVFYLLYPVGLIRFAVLPAHEDGSLLKALAAGLMFGFFTYATYDFTNQATLRNWSTSLSLIDIAWGTSLAAVSATVTVALAMRFWPLR